MTSSEYESRITELESQCRQLEQKVREQSELLQRKKFDDSNTFMIKLTTGWYMRTEDILDDARQLDISFPSDRFCVVTVILDSWGSAFCSSDGSMDKRGQIQAEYTIGRILNELQNSAFDHRFFVSDRHIHGFISVLAESDTFYSQLEASLLYAKSVLCDQFGIEIRFGVSRIHSGLMNVKNCYDESMGVYEYMTMLDMDRPVLTYLEASHGASGKKGPDIGIDFERRIINCFEVGDYEGVEGLIQSVIEDEFENTPPSIEIAKIRFYGVINVILNLMHEFGQAIDAELSVSKESIDALFQSENVTELRTAAESLLGAVVTALNQQSSRDIPQWVLKMADTIRDRYADSNLSAAVLAGEFGLNSTYASRVFKQVMGKGIYEYIHSVRIEAAIILLHEGLSVKDAARAVGYVDSGTMNRAFRKYLGTTASFYTKQKSDR